MATRRTQIINALITHLASNTSILEDNISRNYHVLDEVNDFPALTMIPRTEVREHRGAGRKIATFNIQMRAYAHDGDGSEIINVTEDLGEEIDEAVDTFAASARTHEVEEARVLSFSTDEGLFAPYGIADLEIQIAYEVNV
jgi:vacuolar-type H+-ATPase subunit F/Vma7